MDAKGGNGGAGIGGGHDGFYEISIYGGTIKAVSEANAAGIGGGEEGKAGEVSLSMAAGSLPLPAKPRGFI